MKRLVRRQTVLAVAIAAGVLCGSTQSISGDRADEAVRIAGKRIEDANPEVRAKAVEDLARANNKDGTRYIMQCLASENDGPAGWRMAEAIGTLTSEEALEEVEKSVLKWEKPENLFGAYWTFLGLAGMRTERADKILRKAVDETEEDDIYIRSAVIEALAGRERRDMADLLLKVLKTYDPDWDENSPIIALACIQGAPRFCSGKDKEMRSNIVLALADVLEATKNDRVQWFTCKALANITGEDTYIDPEFWRWWVQIGGKKVQRRGDGATVAGRDVPKFFKAAAVGKRVMFVIDISGSMKHPVELPPEMKNPPKEKPKDKPKGPVTGGGKHPDEDPKKEPPPPPDYSKVKTKLDLAKVELIHTLENLPEDYWFNIVIYDTPHCMIDGGNDEFVQATDGNKKKFVKKVEALNWAEFTNIYGALKRGFCVNMNDTIDPYKLGKKNVNDPSWDPECLRTGATTMFFLTDGSPTVTDDSITEVKAGRMAQGEARYCQPTNILLDVRRLNTFRKCVINTVGIGPHMGPLLANLAGMTGGEYIDRSGVAQR